MGYAWTVLVRYTPRDGPVEAVNLSSGFLDGGVARSVLVKTEPRWKENREQRDDINFEDRSLIRGFETDVTLAFDVIDMAAHHPTIAALVSRARDPYWSVELSLDNGTTYRKVRLAKAGHPRSLGGKTIAGARVEHVFRVVELADTYPDIGAGTSW